MKLDDRHAYFDISGVREQPPTKLCGKIALLIAEDWFALSHFRPLIAVLKEIAQSVVIITRSSGRLSEVEALGVRVIDFDFRRASSNPVLMVKLAWALSRVLKSERPDVLHLVAIKPIVLAGLALKLISVPHVVVHVTGQGLLGVATSPLLRLYRFAMLRVLASLVRHPASYLLVENPDDLASLRVGAADPGPRFAILGGAGVDPDAFPPQPPPANDVPVAAYVGRMIKSKGVDLLVRAYDQLLATGVSLRLELYGKSDAGNVEAIASEKINAWCQRNGARWHGEVTDVVGVWRGADIFVLPSRGGEGLPRAMLEAASCARPLIVTDVPGNRHFVRHGIEGLLVPPEDVTALAAALQQLARDEKLRARMGQAARRRMLDGYTEAQVKQVLLASYQAMLGRVSLPRHVCKGGTITVSIVSHRNGPLLRPLLTQLLACPEVSAMFVTRNVPENLDLPADGRIHITDNAAPAGFGANHNAAFRRCQTPMFCVVNPDIDLPSNPFPTLLQCLQQSDAALAAPLVVTPAGLTEDNLRYFPTPLSLLAKALGGQDGRYEIATDQRMVSPDWVAGMFMLFQSCAFRRIGGFDEGFFLYYEDVDICARLRHCGEAIVACPTVRVVHTAQRTSRYNPRYALWHISSMVRYFVKHLGRLPRSTALR
jgi:glycosyltransferase involved in cell wall biosynthesis/GT2 family glycosyltransferase